MKNPRIQLVLLVAIAAVLVLPGCSSSSSDANNFFLIAAKNTAPVVAAAAGRTLRTDLPDVLNQVYSIIRDYENPRDEGIVDMHNIYKVLWEAGQNYEFAQGACTTMAQKVVASPFNFGLSEQYTCAGNEGTMADTYAKGFAIREEGTTKHGLLSFRWAGTEHGVLQGSYDDTTKELVLNLVEHVAHDQSYFAVRSHIAGNANSHTFTLRLISGNLSRTTLSHTTIKGAGISQGAANKFLFATSQDDGATTTYYCLPGSPTVDDLVDVSPTSDAADCPAAYKTQVDNLDWFTTDDYPKALSDFTDSTIIITP